MNKIASKIAKKLLKYRSSKVINLMEYKKAAANMLEEANKLNKALDLVGVGSDPQHAIFVDAQNLLSLLAQELSNLPEFHKHNKIVTRAEEEYTPSWPPHSPISYSYFGTWGVFDIKVGIDKESYFSCIKDLAPLLGIDPTYVKLWTIMEQGRLGVYKVLYTVDDKVMLEELYTKKQYLSFCASKFPINPGDLWLIRLFPKAHPDFDYHVIFTSPYLLLASEKHWEEFFDRNIMGIRETPGAEKNYENFMINGLSQLYWMEFIMQGYINHTNEVIFLGGLPDIANSRPHFNNNNILPERIAA